MKKCLFLVEGPFDKLRLSLLEQVFDDNKLIIIPFETDKLQKKDYYLNYESEIRALLNIEKTHEIDEFDYLVQVCDTDGCFIDDSKVLETEMVNHTIYYCDHIETKDLNPFIKRHFYKRENINGFLTNNKIKLFYNSTNIDHAFDGIQNPTNNQKRILAINMYKSFKNDIKGFIELLYNSLPNKEKEFIKSWDYIKEECNSLSKASNLFIFLLSNYEEMKDEYKEVIENLLN